MAQTKDSRLTPLKIEYNQVDFFGMGNSQKSGIEWKFVGIRYQRYRRYDNDITKRCCWTQNDRYLP